MDDDRVAALERYAAVQLEALWVMVEQMRALTVVNSALFAHLGDAIDRDVIREAALAAIGSGPENAQAASLVDALVQNPAAAAVDHHAAMSAALADVPGRLN